LSRREKNNAVWSKIKKDQAKVNDKTRRENEGKPKPGKTSGSLPSGRIPGR
jgi:hypothetical protein